jgi:hypothetical protein
MKNFMIAFSVGIIILLKSGSNYGACAKNCVGILLLKIIVWNKLIQ